MSVNPNIVILASDRSSGLVTIAFDKHVADRGQLSKLPKFNNLSSIPSRTTAEKIQQFCPGTDSMISDGLTLPFPHNRFDFVISIAVVHHFSTPERRIQAVKEIIYRLKQNKKDETDEKNMSKALVYVWALEQGSSRRGYHEGMNQDVFVPWVMQKNQAKKKKEPKSRAPKKGKQSKKTLRSEADVHDENKEIENLKKDKNIDIQANNIDGDTKSKDATDLNTKNQKQSLDSLANETETAAKEATGVVKHRYYHLYKQGELEDDIKAAGGRVLESGYSRDNWYAIFTRDD